MEQVIVRMNRQMQMALLGNGPEGSGELGQVERPHDMSPHGMLLAALGECTAILLHSYAGRRGSALEEVEVRLWWEECTDCKDEGSGTEQVRMELWFGGQVDEAERKKLMAVARQCPIHRMLHGGVPVHTEVVEAPPSGWEASPHQHGHGGHEHGHGHGHQHAHAHGEQAQGDGRAHAPPGEVPPDSEGPSVEHVHQHAHGHGHGESRQGVVQAVPATDGEDA